MLTFPPRPFYTHRTQIVAAVAMSSQPKKKETLAQLRAEREEHIQDAIESCQLALMVNRTFYSVKSETAAEAFDRVSALLPPSNHACEQLLYHLHLDPGRF